MVGHTFNILLITGVVNVKIVLGLFDRIGLLKTPLTREFKLLMGFLSLIGLKVDFSSIIISVLLIRHCQLSLLKLKEDNPRNGLLT